MKAASVDHYVQRSVEEVVDTDQGWAIKLTGDIFIHNLVAEYENPGDVLVGKTLQKVALSATQTTLYFGDDDNPLSTRVNLVPTRYGIVDEVRHGADMVMPQAGPEVFEVPPEPEGRVAEGPTPASQEPQAAPEGAEVDEDTPEEPKGSSVASQEPDAPGRHES